ncbi:hypothetical protein MLD38_022874 [Melastoma candidum]|uniref:Uncharacterized protein n=1 Tax=Melastoma candidum TaxID=119954 RepID=A0ACB9QNS2_9MYRT|nr:hypothetical protein MLD38_022874 [Melastoma candidum]
MLFSCRLPSHQFVGSSAFERSSTGRYEAPLPGIKTKRLVLGRCGAGDTQGGGRKTFLTLEEAGLVEISGLNTHERFLCRLTISSLNLLRVVAEQEGCSIEELNAGRVCDWFLKDKLKREQNIGSAVLQWDDSDLLF